MAQPNIYEISEYEKVLGPCYATIPVTHIAKNKITNAQQGIF